jgi:plasmid maintenance system antidote protein VapI
MDKAIDEPGTLSQLLLLTLIENNRLRRTLRKRERTKPRRTRRIERASDMALRLRVDLARIGKGLTHHALAIAIGASRPRVSAVLSGSQGFPRSWLAPVAHVLGVSPEQLLAGLDWAPRTGGRQKRTAGQPRVRRQKQESERNRAMRLRLRDLLRSHGKRHVDLAQHVGVSRPTVTRVLSGSMSLPPAWMPKVNSFFDLSPAELLGAAA